MKLDEIDVLILQELQKESRLSIRELSRRVNLSPPSVTERVRRLEDNGVIEGYTIDCIIKVTMRNGQYEKFKIFIKEYKQSEWCYRIAGDGCFLVKLSIRSLNDIEEFINDISSYAMTETIIALSEVTINNNIKKYL